MEIEGSQILQPEVSRIKFEAELREFRNVEHDFRKRGIICLKVEYPNIYFAFLTHQLKPAAVAFAVRINFTNYDVEPPSLVFVDPLTLLPIPRKEMNVSFFQVKEAQQIQGLVGGLPGIPPLQLQPPPQEVLMGRPNDQPFLCIPGIREYHEHPAHTGDSWFLYRTKGEGKLGFVIDQLYNHSIPYVRSFNINFNVTLAQHVQ